MNEAEKKLLFFQQPRFYAYMLKRYGYNK